ncbi:hypothetical protein LCGC14_2997440 [marine sediment metagenome]|uniref:Uncharacterized protein n=1 Tax=marine sediment metagenome TaxID=412755 RepID=A0A0F8X2I1_9ZZZZ
MTDQEIIQLLKDTGHLEFPMGSASIYPVESQSLDDGSVALAISSYQDFMLFELDRLCLAHHSRPARPDGG